MAGTLGTGWRESYMGGSPAAEEAILARVLPQIERIQDFVAAHQQASPHRAFHNKGSPLAVELVVSADIPPTLGVPFLAPGGVYRGFARFSRSQSFHRRDGDLDQRGFAFRVETDAGPQDFLLSNTPVSFARDAVMFMTAASILVEHSLLVAPFRLARAIGIRDMVHVLLNLARPPDRTVAFTSQRYWSRTPYAFGEAAARLFVRPLDEMRRVAAKDDPDFLTTDLAVDLKANARTFELCALPFVDEARTPIEDASREWPETVTAPVVLGRVVLPFQDVAGPEGQALAERVEHAEAFNPYVTPGLRPLGRTNRARLVAYRHSAEHRGAPASAFEHVSASGG